MEVYPSISCCFQLNSSYGVVNFLCSLVGPEAITTTVHSLFPATLCSGGKPSPEHLLPHTSCPLSHGNHLSCFVLLAAYTFILFDHILSSWASKHFCYDGWKILDRSLRPVSWFGRLSKLALARQQLLGARVQTARPYFPLFVKYPWALDV